MSRFLDIRGNQFVDRLGRHVILRGVNFAADTKVPLTPDQRTFVPADFSDHRTVSFVGRPAPLEELDIHLDRLAHWGFNCLRLITTWEAVEHAGPGQYDEEYLDYFAEVCRRAGARGFYVFVDFHQDVWARMSGGDGAPGWTFEVAGLDFTKFDKADAALLMQKRYDPSKGGRQESYPSMSWGRNYAMPANGIMWTLFFAGSIFAPSARVGNENIGDYLQRHYLGSMRALAERVADQEHVVGFDTLNEPGTGYVGKLLEQDLTFGGGLRWTPLHGLASASGAAQKLPVLAHDKSVVGEVTVNAAGESIWLPGFEDPFRKAGVWGFDEMGRAVALKSDHFTKIDGREIDINRDIMAPFFNRVALAVRQVRPDWLIFAEVSPFALAAGNGFPSGCPDKTVNASHWYDLTSLVLKSFSAEKMVNLLTGQVSTGREQIEASYKEQMQQIKAAGDQLNGGAPTLIGEFGIPYDMNGEAAYKRWAQGERAADVWSAQTEALNLMYNAIDQLLLSSTQWNYTLGNRNDAMIGDGWNQEDLSIWSSDQHDASVDELDSGARALHGFCRPYVKACQGKLLSQRFDKTAASFEAEIEVDAAIEAPTEIYVPAVQFPNGITISLGSSSAEVKHTGSIISVASSLSEKIIIHIRGRDAA
ncbi:cellulase family glycosylhydrolase [Halopseudomonas salegens]|uniref:Cellulase (Glycosyl hydrolase family 5) n=1 Tax=Halopseudomonas salegens TaxID=1434072 RepID=A0A1H2E570_9GAMM|nr:cellulase family glycosylhydrolase [Halopseudomonas salegens]SDT90175.1 Cellulase (glycosyl hydrolase family 5) [Halopseudomonas salegens]